MTKAYCRISGTASLGSYSYLQDCRTGRIHAGGCATHSSGRPGALIINPEAIAYTASQSASFSLFTLQELCLTLQGQYDLLLLERPPAVTPDWASHPRGLLRSRGPHGSV